MVRLKPDAPRATIRLKPDSTRSGAVIEVQHLTKRYGPVTAVDDVSFKAERGEILGFLGPNGAGKTTTMRILTGYMPPSEGKAFVGGYDVQEKAIEAKRRTGYLPETPPLYPDMTVRDYLDFCARIKGVPRAERTARVKTSMERTRIADVARRHCGKLSKGYRQRVGLAQALLHLVVQCGPVRGRIRRVRRLDRQLTNALQVVGELAQDRLGRRGDETLPEIAQRHPPADDL